MGRNSITTDEYFWAQKVCKHCRLAFDEFEDDPSAEELAEHCEQRRFELKATLGTHAGKKGQLTEQKQISYFEALQKNCEKFLSQADLELQADDPSKANIRLDEAEALLKTMESFIKQAWLPLNEAYAQALKTQRATLQSYYLAVGDTPDKATKREFEAQYLPIINLIAETEDLIDGQGQSAEEAVKRNIAELDTQIDQIRQSMNKAVWAAERLKFEARIAPKPSEKSNQTSGAPQQASPSQTATDRCKAKQEATMRRINELLAQEGRIHDPELQAAFARDEQLVAQVNGVINRLLRANSVDSAHAELAQLEKIASRLQGCIDQADKSNARRESEQAGVYRKALVKKQKTTKRLAAQQAKIIDPEKAQDYAKCVAEVNDTISEVGWTLASGQANRIELAEQALPQIDALIEQAQGLYRDALARQQLDESLYKQGNECKLRANKVWMSAEKLGKKLDALSVGGEKAELEALLQSISDKMQEITLTLQTDALDRVDTAEGLLEVLQVELQQMQLAYEAAIEAEKHKQPKKNEIKYRHRAEGVRNNVDSRATPSGRNPEFYCETQSGHLCVKHAINACLGFGAITEEDITTGLYAGTIESYERQTENQLFREVRRHFPDMTPADMRRELAKDRDAFYRKAAKKQFEELFDGLSPEAYVKQNGADTEIGIAALRAKQKALGLPDLKNTYLEPADTPGGLQQNLEKLREITDDEAADRLVLGYGGHLVALRKNTEGDWFEIDSFEDSAKRVDLEEYIKTKALVLPQDRLVLLHFDGDVNPDATETTDQAGK